MSEEIEYTLGSDNVFADLDLPNPEERLLKAALAREIALAIEEYGLTQAQAAERMGLDQPKVSAIVRGRLTGFSVERLLRCLTALGRDVTITVKEAETERGRVALVTP